MIEKMPQNQPSEIYGIPNTGETAEARQARMDVAQKTEEIGSIKMEIIAKLREKSPEAKIDFNDPAVKASLDEQAERLYAERHTTKIESNDLEIDPHKQEWFCNKHNVKLEVVEQEEGNVSLLCPADSAVFSLKELKDQATRKA